MTTGTAGVDGATGVRIVDVTPVLRFCAVEAARTNHEHIGTEHLALAAIDGPGGLAETGAPAGVTADRLRECLGACCPHPRMGACDDEPRATPRVVRMLAAASQMAFAERTASIEARHLLLTLLAEPGAVAWKGIIAAGISPEQVADAARVRPNPSLAAPTSADRVN